MNRIVKILSLILIIYSIFLISPCYADFFGLFEIKEGEYILMKDITISIPYNVEQGSKIPLTFPADTIIYIEESKDD